MTNDPRFNAPSYIRIELRATLKGVNMRVSVAEPSASDPLAQRALFGSYATVADAMMAAPALVDAEIARVQHEGIHG